MIANIKTTRCKIENKAKVHFSYIIISREKLVNEKLISWTHHMLQISLCRLAVAVSRDQLVNEISNGIEKLNGYSKNFAGVSIKGGIYVILERDLIMIPIRGYKTTKSQLNMSSITFLLRRQ